MYFLRKCEVSLTRCEVCPQGHIMVSLRDDQNNKMDFRKVLRKSIFP